MFGYDWSKKIENKKIKTNSSQFIEIEQCVKINLVHLYVDILLIYIL